VDEIPTQRELDAALAKVEKGKQLTDSELRGLEGASRQSGAFGGQARKAVDKLNKSKK
jgi:hypothetical protein